MIRQISTITFIAMDQRRGAAVVYGRIDWHLYEPSDLVAVPRVTKNSAGSPATESTSRNKLQLLRF